MVLRQTSSIFLRTAVSYMSLRLRLWHFKLKQKNNMFSGSTCPVINESKSIWLKCAMIRAYCDAWTIMGIFDGKKLLGHSDSRLYSDSNSIRISCVSHIDHLFSDFLKLGIQNAIQDRKSTYHKLLRQHPARVWQTFWCRQCGVPIVISFVFSRTPPNSRAGASFHGSHCSTCNWF